MRKEKGKKGINETPGSSDYVLLASTGRPSFRFRGRGASRRRAPTAGEIVNNAIGVGHINSKGGAGVVWRRMSGAADGAEAGIGTRWIS